MAEPLIRGVAAYLTVRRRSRGSLPQLHLSALRTPAAVLHHPYRCSISAAVVSLRERTRPGLGIIEPCLPSPAKAPPSGPGWLHEIKHDGFRILARRDSAGVRLITRAGNDFSSRFPFIAMALGNGVPGFDHRSGISRAGYC
jgi:ATP-dependent DNA ligase